MADREILTKMLARVEGEGAMEVRVRDGRVQGAEVAEDRKVEGLVGSKVAAATTATVPSASDERKASHRADGEGLQDP